MAAQYKAATRLPDQTITMNGQKIPCYVVRVTSAESKLPQSQKYTWEQTLWIAKSTWLLRRTLRNSNGFTIVTSTVHIPEQNRSVTTYSTVRLNSPIPASLFRFNPPPNAHLVAKFDETYSMALNMAGKTAPNVQLVNAQGKRVPLSSWRGRPVLLDFWATWCGPCIASMPKLAELYQQAAPKGLVLLSIDEDADVKKADAYLAKHHYNWPNTQDDGSLGDAFHKLGIPLYALIDAQGKIVYSGFGPEKALRKAIAGLGPQFASLAPQQPCKPASN